MGVKTESIKMSLNVTQDVPQMSPKVLIKKLLYSKHFCKQETTVLTIWNSDKLRKQSYQYRLCFCLQFRLQFHFQNKICKQKNTTVRDKCPSNVTQDITQQHVLDKYGQHTMILIRFRPQCGRICLSDFLNLFLTMGRLSMDRHLS